MYVGLENDDRLVAIDTHSNKMIASIPVGQAPQAIAYVPNAVSNTNSERGLVPLQRAASATHLALHDVGKDPSNARSPATTVALYDRRWCRCYRLR
jgi:YVTN family beta-propeller protein